MTKAPFIDRAIGYFAPQWAAKRAYYRAAIDAIPSMDAVYGGSIATRVDSAWSRSRGLQGFNAPTAQWRLTLIRDRCREVVRNNALAAGMLERAVENVIGSGMKLAATTDDTAFNEQAEELWRDWWEGADLTGLAPGVEFERIFFRSHLQDGDVGAALVSRGSDAFLQGIEGDLINTMTGGNMPGQNVIDGIKLNDDGRPVAFYILNYGISGQQLESTPINARDFAFYPRRKRFSQLRGEPCFTQVLQLFDQIEGYKEATVIAARIAACQGLVIKSNNGPKAFGTLPTATNSQSNSQKLMTMEPGMIHYLQVGEEVQTVNPNQPTAQFSDFISQLVRFAGVTMGLPLELLMLDFSRTNYSSARASLLQAYRTFRSHQQSFCSHFMARVYRWRVSKWVKDGTLNPPASIAANYWDHQWIAPGWAWVDPVKEIQAAMMEVDAGLTSRTDLCHQHGRDFENIAANIAREKKMLADLGVEVSRSNMTRDAVMPVGNDHNATTNANPETDETENPTE